MHLSIVSPPSFSRLFVRFVKVTISADAFISNCSTLVYWLCRNGGFCLGVPHKRGFALIPAVFPLRFSLVASLYSFRGPRSTTPEVNSPRRVGRKRGRSPVIYLLLSSFSFIPLPALSLLFLWLACFGGSELTRAHVHARRTTFFSLSYRYFFAPPHKLPFSVDFPCFMRPTSAINVIASDPTPPPAHLFLTIYSLYVTFLAKNTFRPGQLLMNADPAGFPSSTSMLCFLFFLLFFVVSGTRELSGSSKMRRLVVTRTRDRFGD